MRFQLGLEAVEDTGLKCSELELYTDIFEIKYIINLGLVNRVQVYPYPTGWKSAKWVCQFPPPLTKVQGPLFLTQPAPKSFTTDNWSAAISPPQWNNLLSYSYLQSAARAWKIAADKLQEQLESIGDFTLSTVYSLLSQPTQMCTCRYVFCSA